MALFTAQFADALTEENIDDVSLPPVEVSVDAALFRVHVCRWDKEDIVHVVESGDAISALDVAWNGDPSEVRSVKIEWLSKAGDILRAPKDVQV